MNHLKYSVAFQPGHPTRHPRRQLNLPRTLAHRPTTKQACLPFFVYTNTRSHENSKNLMLEQLALVDCLYDDRRVEPA